MAAPSSARFLEVNAIALGVAIVFFVVALAFPPKRPLDGTSERAVAPVESR